MQSNVMDRSLQSLSSIMPPMTDQVRNEAIDNCQSRKSY